MRTLSQHLNENLLNEDDQDLLIHLKKQAKVPGELRKDKNGAKWKIGRNLVEIKPSHIKGKFSIRITTPKSMVDIGSYDIDSITREFLLERINRIIER